MSDDLRQWFRDNGYNEEEIAEIETSKVDVDIWEGSLSRDSLTVGDIGRNPRNPVGGEQPTTVKDGDEAPAVTPFNNLMGEGGDSSSIPPLLQDELFRLGAIEGDGNKGYAWVSEGAEEFYGYVNDHSVAAGGEMFKIGTPEGINEAQQYVAELGIGGRDDLITTNYEASESPHQVFMPQSGRSIIIKASEINAIEDATGQSRGDVTKAVRASGLIGVDWRVTLLAHSRREQAGLGGSIRQTAEIVSTGLKKFNNSSELAYLYASEWEQEKASDPLAAGELKVEPAYTMAEQFYVDKSRVTDEQLNWKDEALNSYRRLAQSGSSFSSNEGQLNYLTNYGFDSRTPSVQVSENEARATFRDLYQNLFLTTPDDETLDAFQRQFEGDITSWSQREDAMVTDLFGKDQQMVGDMYAKPTASDSSLGFIQDSDLYSDLYGEEFQKSGLSEGQYGARFGNYALGSFQDPNNVRAAGQAGMRSGNIEDVDSFALTKRGMEDPSIQKTMVAASEFLRNLR